LYFIYILQKNGLIWFKNDLRLHDNQTLVAAVAACDSILPIYIIDPSWSESTVYGFRKTGAIRMQFIAECIADLKQQLRNTGSDLYVYYGKPEKIIPKLVLQYRITDVFTKQEFGCDEVSLNQKINKLTQSFRIKFHTYNTNTLFDLDFKIIVENKLLENFSNFKQYVLDNCTVPIIQETARITSTINCDDSIADADIKNYLTLTNSANFICGGESAALHQAECFFNEVHTSKNNTKFSAWFAQGCLSVRYINQQISAANKSNKEQYNSLITDLIWRDYYYYQFAKHGKYFFRQGGVHNKKLACIKDYAALQHWITAQTENEFVNASMQELKKTGWINRLGRQAVVDYLSKQLLVDWRIGGAYFESQLIDYDVCQNYGNWANKVGVGADITDNGNAIVINQIKHESYINQWLEK
jgi:deoxyribodipyrimidine photo-lyase